MVSNAPHPSPSSTSHSRPPVLPNIPTILNPKGHITESDLRQFAEGQGLPVAYVKPFLDALLARPASESQADSEAGEEIGFRRFKRCAAVVEGSGGGA